MKFKILKFTLVNPDEAVCKPTTQFHQKFLSLSEVWHKGLPAPAPLRLQLKVWSWNCQQRCACGEILQTGTAAAECRHAPLPARLVDGVILLNCSGDLRSESKSQPFHTGQKSSVFLSLLLICKASLLSTSKSLKGIYHTLLTVFCITIYKVCICTYTYIHIIYIYTHNIRVERCREYLLHHRQIFKEDIKKTCFKLK